MNLFYSTTKKNLIDLENNCCSFDEWMKDKGANDCCKHENGFYIFLNPEEIESSDEYKNNDPYVVMDQLESDFQQRRFT